MHLSCLLKAEEEFAGKKKEVTSVRRDSVYTVKELWPNVTRVKNERQLCVACPKGSDRMRDMHGCGAGSYAKRAWFVLAKEGNPQSFIRK